MSDEENSENSDYSDYSEYNGTFSSNSDDDSTSNEFSTPPPLIYAVENNDSKLLAELLSEEAVNIYVEDVDGRTPLTLASINGNVTLMNILLKKQRQLQVTVEPFLNRLFLAIKWNLYESATEFVKRDDFQINSPVDQHHNTVLHHLCSLYHYNNNKEDTVILVKELLQHGAKIDILNNESMTALHFAAGRCPTKILDLLLKHRAASVNVIDETGRTPLHHAVAADQEDNVRALLFYGAEINRADKDGNIPIDFCSNINYSMKQIFTNTEELFIHAEKGDLKKVKECLMNGAMFNARGGAEKTFTAMYYAAWNSHLKIVKYLLKLGANPTYE